MVYQVPMVYQAPMVQQAPMVYQTPAASPQQGLTEVITAIGVAGKLIDDHWANPRQRWRFQWG